MGGFRVAPVAAVLCVAGCSSPEPAPPPADCVRYDAGLVDAAAGHRGFVLTLTNCGTALRPVAGYPDVHVLDGRGANWTSGSSRARPTWASTRGRSRSTWPRAGR